MKARILFFALLVFSISTVQAAEKVATEIVLTRLSAANETLCASESPEGVIGLGGVLNETESEAFKQKTRKTCECNAKQIKIAREKFAAGELPAELTMGDFNTMLAPIVINKCAAEQAKAEMIDACKKIQETEALAEGKRGNEKQVTERPDKPGDMSASQCRCVQQQTAALSDEEIVEMAMLAYKDYQRRVQAILKKQPKPDKSPPTPAMQKIESSCKMTF